MTDDETYPVTIDEIYTSLNPAPIPVKRTMKYGERNVQIFHDRNYKVRISAKGEKGRKNFKVALELVKEEEARGGTHKRKWVPLKDKKILRSYVFPEMGNLDEDQCRKKFGELKDGFERRIEEEYLPLLRIPSRTLDKLRDLKNPVKAVVEEPKKFAYLVVQCGVWTLLFNEKAENGGGMKLLSIPFTQDNIKNLKEALKLAFRKEAGAELDSITIPKKLSLEDSSVTLYGATARVKSLAAVSRIISNPSVVQMSYGQVANNPNIDERSRLVYATITNPEPKPEKK
ncbi:MAG TPA: hypothetical protein PKI93_05775 [Alphaproteobacteria bacterium]|nr:hypothetical protein [Alphaproteobacteria bacterium]HNS44890.1 hypothetical protein [Alphaproteobacteria bacterium]